MRRIRTNKRVQKVGTALYACQEARLSNGTKAPPSDSALVPRQFPLQLSHPMPGYKTGVGECFFQREENLFHLPFEYYSTGSLPDGGVPSGAASFTAPQELTCCDRYRYQCYRLHSALFIGTSLNGASIHYYPDAVKGTKKMEKLCGAAVAFTYTVVVHALANTVAAGTESVRCRVVPSGRVRLRRFADLNRLSLIAMADTSP